MKNSYKQKRVQDFVNEGIKRLRVSKVKVVLEGDLKEMTLHDAISLAEDKNLDLVCVSPKTDPPICKIMDYGKYQYAQKKKANLQKKKQKQTEVKEIKLRPVTEDHDLEHKIKKIREFLEDGDKVKLTVRFRGRELKFKENARERLDKIIKATEDISKVGVPPKMLGRNMTMLLEKKTNSTKAKVEKPE